MLSIFDVFVGVNWCSSNILVFHGYIIAIFAIFAHLPRIIICSLCIPEYMFASELFCYSIWIGAIWEVTLLRIRCSFLPFLLLMFGSTSIFSRIPQLYLKWYQNCWRIVIFFKTVNVLRVNSKITCLRFWSPLLQGHFWGVLLGALLIGSYYFCI